MAPAGPGRLKDQGETPCDRPLLWSPGGQDGAAPKRLILTASFSGSGHVSHTGQHLKVQLSSGNATAKGGASPMR